MIKNYIEKANFEDTGFSYTLSLINGKYKMVILYCLMEFGVVRYSELKRYIRSISHKTLSLSLKELEKDRLIIRTEYPQIPPKVEYSLSERGKSLMTISTSFAHGARKINLLKNKAARCLRAALYSIFNYAKITGAPAQLILLYKTQNLQSA